MGIRIFTASWCSMEMGSACMVQRLVEELGIFDPIINGDSNYFINIKRLRETNIPEFEGTYDKINKFFHNIGQLLLAANGDITHKAYKTLDISSAKYPKYEFENGIMINPYKKDKALLLVPINILHEIPIAKDWDNIDRVCSENKNSSNN